MTLKWLTATALLVVFGMTAGPTRAEEDDRYWDSRYPSPPRYDARDWRDWAYSMWGPARGRWDTYDSRYSSRYSYPTSRNSRFAPLPSSRDSRYAPLPSRDPRYAPPPPSRDPRYAPPSVGREADWRAEVDRKLDRLQRELDDLRRDLRRR